MEVGPSARSARGESTQVLPFPAVRTDTLPPSKIDAGGQATLAIYPALHSKVKVA
jgi:hypothetical protein